MAKAVVIEPDGSVRGEDPSTLKDYQSLVGGYIEVVTLDDDIAVYLNEEGRGVLDDNIPASFLMAALMPPPYGKQWLDFNGPVQGAVVFIGPTDDDGNTLDLPDEAIVLIELMVAAMDLPLV